MPEGSNSPSSEPAYLAKLREELTEGGVTAEEALEAARARGEEITAKRKEIEERTQTAESLAVKDLLYGVAAGKRMVLSGNMEP